MADDLEEIGWFDPATDQWTAETVSRLSTDPTNIFALLGQTEVWFDASGGRHLVAEMSVRYKTNVIGFLERRAGRLEFGYSLRELLIFGDHLGEHAADGMLAAQAIRAEDPLAWLRTTPLLIRLNDDVAANRGGKDD